MLYYIFFNCRYCVVFDPLDGSSNIDCGVSIGTVCFSSQTYAMAIWLVHCCIYLEMLKITICKNYPDITVINWMFSLLCRSLGFICWKMVLSQLLIMFCNQGRIWWQLVIACMEALARYNGYFLCVNTSFFFRGRCGSLFDNVRTWWVNSHSWFGFFCFDDTG